MKYSGRLVSVFTLGVVTLSAQPALLSAKESTELLGGARVGGGLATVKNGGSKEIDKKGTAFEGLALLSWELPQPGHRFGLGLGLQKWNVKGESISRGLTQEFKVTAGVAELSYMYGFYDSIYAGLGAEVLFGKGAAFDPLNKTGFATPLSLRPLLQYRWDLESVLPFAEVSYAIDLTNKSRAVSRLTGGLGIFFRFDQPDPAPQITPSPVPTAVPPTPMPTVEPTVTPTVAPSPVPKIAPTPAAPQVLKVNLDTKAVNFGVGSSRLSKESSQKLIKAGAILAKYEKNWGALEVTGHTDASGKPESNQKLSKARAKAVVEALVAGGANKAKLKSDGLASTMLLPGIEPKSPKHRRVEFAFAGTQGEGVAEMAAQITQLFK